MASGTTEGGESARYWETSIFMRSCDVALQRLIACVWSLGPLLYFNETFDGLGFLVMAASVKDWHCRQAQAQFGNLQQIEDIQ